MNRPIKFRAWNGQNWYTFNLSTLANGSPTIQRLLMDDSTVVVQSTGLFDKDGKEIYEGYIVKLWPQYSNLKVADMRWLPTWADQNFTVGEDGFGGNESEIIGNIYENPELLTI